VCVRVCESIYVCVSVNVSLLVQGVICNMCIVGMDYVVCNFLHLLKVFSHSGIIVQVSLYLFMQLYDRLSVIG
jgi:hypothetical protein